MRETSLAAVAAASARAACDFGDSFFEGIDSTQLVFPCGSEELAVAVADLVRRDTDPSHAIVGLRNHGITAVGGNLTEILDRIEPKVLRQVPMSG